MARARGTSRRLSTHYSYLYKNSNTAPWGPFGRARRIACGATPHLDIAKMGADGDPDQISDRGPFPHRVEVQPAGDARPLGANDVKIAT
jgi:hypothetical protein